jgi:hypothetical protein
MSEIDLTPTDRGGPPVPDTLDVALTPEWLTAALGTRYPGIEVTRVTPGPVISRVATNARFHIECAGGVPAGLSPDLCIKGYLTEYGKPYRHAGVPEAAFYREVLGLTGMNTLRCVYADCDPETSDSAVITEDVVALGAEFLDARSDYTPDQCAQSLEELAALHAGTWMAPKAAALSSLDSRLELYTANRGRTEISANFDGEIGAGVPAAVRDADALYEAYSSLGRQVPSEEPWCVIHGDAHVGNVFLNADGRPSFVDWQLVQRGPWYLDVGYHMSSAITVEDRRANERDLVRHYLQHLAALGGDAPSEDEAWRLLPRGMVHGFYLWAITVRVLPEITAKLNERLGTAVDDHDGYAAVTKGT